VWGAGRVSVRLSPNDSFMGVADSDPPGLFAEAARVLQGLGIAFLELRHPGKHGSFGAAEGEPLGPMIREIFTGPLVLNADYDAARAEADIRAGRCDAVSFGRPYISNPDLVERIAAGVTFAPNRDAPESWYTPGAAGYTDYPRYGA
jgi:2,4-dienoyl-CoA reductase-like NADH-dependent reductase (Old Yellow Enzyme family)